MATRPDATRLAAIVALQLLGREARPAAAGLRPLTSDAIPRLRAESLTALMSLTAEPAALIPEIRTAMKDPDSQVRLSAATAQPVIQVLEGVAKAVEVMIGFAMRVAPLGVFALIFAVTSTFGIEVLRSLGLYVVMVLVGLVIHQFGVIGLLARILGGISPVTFFRRARGLMITAFSTSSSNATLPTNIRTAEQEFGVPSEIAGFVLPLGATMNMNGTALFEGVSVLFLAQVAGVELGLGSQAIVVVMAVLTAVGAAGVPSGSIPLLVLVLEMVGVPGEGIALILGVDRILDMSRTVPNVTGDLLASIVITRSEGLPLVISEQPAASL